MQFMAALSLAMTVIDAIKTAAPVVKEVITDWTPIGEAVITKVTGKSLTEDQREQLTKQIISNHERFQQPIPSEDQQ